LSDIAISDEEFEKFREFFYRKTGIQFEPSKRYFVDKRLVDRIDATKSGDFRTYFMLLRFQASGEELQLLTNLMTVNETYFFREEYQFECLVRSLLPEIVRHKSPGQTLRIWSIPSSSGEEPYSIAIYISEFWPDIVKWDVELLSSDIDTEILRKAKRGKYGVRSVQNVPIHLLSRYFERDADGDYQICDDLRSAVATC
jgi:chemotaxis protein methyltransferase CheR